MGDRFTIVGGRGFIGGALSAALRAAGDDVTIVTHRDPVPSGALGHVIYASGVAASVAGDAAYAYGAHVEGVRRFLASGAFDSFVFLSSARVYGNAVDTREDAALSVAPAAGADIYRISKIAGEALCLAHPSPGVRAARLSNVTGESFDSSLFVSDVLRQAARTGRVAVRTTRDSGKDYISIADVCRYLPEIARHGSSRLYNVAFGGNVENGAIYDVLAAHGISVDIAADAARAVTPVVNAQRIQLEFGPPRETLLAQLPALIERFGTHFAGMATR